jgi:hypothetical protein
MLLTQARKLPPGDLNNWWASLLAKFLELFNVYLKQSQAPKPMSRFLSQLFAASYLPEKYRNLSFPGCLQR